MTRETAMRTGRESGGRTSGIGRPLLGSAAGHLVLLAGLLLLGASAGPGLPGIVQVFLVEGIAENGSAGEASAPAFDGEMQQEAGTRSGAELEVPRTPGAGNFREWSPAAQFPVTSSTPDGGEPVPPSGVPSSGAREGMPREAGISVGGPAGGAEKRATLPLADASGGGGGGRGGAEIRGLRERIESRIVYPEDAIRRGQEGEVLLRIRVGEGGVPQEIRVARSSGARTLDEAARNGVVRAAPLPSLPGWFEVPIRFSLR
jgi:TonB family protein